MDEIETKPIVIALVINLAIIFLLPRLFPPRTTHRFSNESFLPRLTLAA